MKIKTSTAIKILIFSGLFVAWRIVLQKSIVESFIAVCLFFIIYLVAKRLYTGFKLYIGDQIEDFKEEYHSTAPPEPKKASILLTLLALENPVLLLKGGIREKVKNRLKNELKDIIPK